MFRLLVVACTIASSAFLMADEPRRFDVSGVLGFKNGATIAELLEAVAKSRSAENRRTAAALLRSIASQAVEEERKEIADGLPPLLAKGKQALGGDAINELLEAAGRTKQPAVLPSLYPHIKDSPYQAIGAIANIGDPQACKELFKYVQDVKFSHRAGAIEAIAIIGTEADFQQLEKLHDKEKLPAIKEHMAKALDAMEKRLKANDKN